ncbi:hypothetical protein EJ05DRAFT_537263 [Pseudovirgaria hyperparasitica]|uniref:C2H2-type domain-containing protein n=1 Tax=Pseudovirgaria hyperparasitica TaxID=470096 RepID=A0A6A6WAL0_9PEZI|nr:uncharacterized protein EJ05DRAFT_537263 [Pseudovirgaria hyperparasitica]KAF2758866.1 hypothetical protein EJ05DRAFT_537263 [Pseudovirgaria hyperparasitica]
MFSSLNSHQALLPRSFDALSTYQPPRDQSAPQVTMKNPDRCDVCSCVYVHVDKGPPCSICANGSHIAHLHLPTDKPDKYTRWECLVANCTVKDELKFFEKHMEKDHFYCRKCHAAFKDWETLVKHRISSPLHYACNFCGIEFKSIHGIKRHVQLDHPPKQNLKCIGCGDMFDRAASMVNHLEQGHCAVITPQEFAGHMQQKMIIDSVLRDKPSVLPGPNHILAAVDLDEGGGVCLLQGHNILEADEASGHPKIASLQPEKKPTCNSTRSQYPSLQSSTGTSGLDSFSGMSISSSAALSSKAASSTVSTIDDDDGSQKPWGSQTGASKTLFPESRPTPVDHDWLEGKRQADIGYARQNGSNLFKDRYWDPSSERFKAEAFFNAVMEFYECPFNPCNHKSYLPSDLVHHIQTSHRAIEYRCPCCFKWFKTAAALMGHAEAAGTRCRISKTENYREAVNQFSAGFIQANEGKHPDIPVQKVVGYSLDKDDELVPTSTESIRHNVWTYESSKPSDWESGQEQRKVEYERSQLTDPFGYNQRYAHINTATHFEGGRPSLPSMMHHGSLFPERDIMGGSSSKYSDGLRTQQEALQGYTLLDPQKLKQQKKRNAWSKFAAGIESVDKYNELISGSDGGSIKVDGFDSEDEGEATETE